MHTGSKSAMLSVRQGCASRVRGLAYWLGLGLVVVLGVVAYLNLAAFSEATAARVRLRDSKDSVLETLSIVLYAESGQRGYLLTGNDSYLEPAQAASMVVDAKLREVDSLSQIMPELEPQVEALRDLVTFKLAELQGSVALMRTQGREAALEVVLTSGGKAAMNDIRVLAAEIRDAINVRLRQYDDEMSMLSVGTVIWGLLGNALAASLFFWMHIERRGELKARTRLEKEAVQRTQSVDAMQKQIAALSQRENGVSKNLLRESGEFAPAAPGHTAAQSEKEIATLGQQSRDLATRVEASRLQTLVQSDGKIAAMGQVARELARSVETSRIQTLNQSEKAIKALGQQARDLATSVETSRIQTLVQSDKEIEALGQQARDLATTVETSRIQTLNQSDKEIEGLVHLARELARSVETSRIQALMQSDKEIEALGEQARDLATSVEVLRIQTLNQSDKEIEALGQQAREVATSVEKSRIQALNTSNKEIRKLNEELEQRVLVRTAELEVANKELESFSYSVSHDLRAPLRAIDGFSRIFLEEYSSNVESDGKALLQRVRDNTRQMGQLVDDLLAFSRLGRQEITKHSVDPNKIVRRCLEDLVKEQQGRQIELVIGELPACNADRALLTQVWTNLISNAFKYTRKRELARIEIGCCTQPRAAVDGQALAADRTDPEVVYFVKDNGAGFDMKYANKLFGVFQRLHREAEYEGTGVGLAIVQRIVQRHGGRVWGEAVPNQGATLSFTLE